MRTPRSLPRLSSLLPRPTPLAFARPTPPSASSAFAAARPLFPAARPCSLLASSSSRPSLSSAFASPAPTAAAAPALGQQVRFATYGAEYQPSQVRRKRKHGFLVRKRSRNGRKTLERRWAKGRKYLSH